MHVHLLLSPANAAELAQFVGYIKRNISEELGRRHKWRGPLWERRYDAIVVADDDSQVGRLHYILEQGCKEGLVASPREWPGVHCVEALCDGAPMRGTWLDRSALYLARRRKDGVERSQFEQVYPVHLSPLPCWRGLSEFERRTRCTAMVTSIEGQTASNNAAHDRRPVGAALVRAQNPHRPPRSSSRSPAPLVHVASKRVREIFRAAYRPLLMRFAARPSAYGKASTTRSSPSIRSRRRGRS